MSKLKITNNLYEKIYHIYALIVVVLCGGSIAAFMNYTDGLEIIGYLKLLLMLSIPLLLLFLMYWLLVNSPKLLGLFLELENIKRSKDEQ